MLSKTQLQRHLSSPAVRQPRMSSVVLTKENAANGIPLQLATLHKRFADVAEKMNQMSEHVDVLTEKMDAIENMLLKRNIAAPAPVQAAAPVGMPLAAGAVRSGYQIPQAKAQAQAQAPRQSKIDDWMTVSRVTTAGVPSIPVVRSSPVVVVGQVAHGQAGAGNDDDDAKK